MPSPTMPPSNNEPQLMDIDPPNQLKNSAPPPRLLEPSPSPLVSPPQQLIPNIPTHNTSPTHQLDPLEQQPSHEDHHVPLYSFAHQPVPTTNPPSTINPITAPHGNAYTDCVALLQAELQIHTPQSRLSSSLAQTTPAIKQGATSSEDQVANKRSKVKTSQPKSPNLQALTTIPSNSASGSPPSHVRPSTTKRRTPKKNKNSSLPPPPNIPPLPTLPTNK